MSAKEVLLEGASPWGFRMTGGCDTLSPLRISRVNPGSKASEKGVREGDLITSINQQPTKNLTNSQSHALLRTVKENLLLGLNQDVQISPKKRFKDKNPAPEPPSSPAGDKKSSSKLRRERRSKLKQRLKGFFGLGKHENGQIESKSDAGSERGPEEDPTETTARRASDGSVCYDYCSGGATWVVETEEAPAESVQVRIIQEEQESGQNDSPSYNEVYGVCRAYLDGKENNVPPDLIPLKEVKYCRSECDQTNAKPAEPGRDRLSKNNDMNNNKSRGRGADPPDRISSGGKRVHIVHSPDEYQIVIEGADGEPLLRQLPEDSAELCKATVSFEDGSGRLVAEGVTKMTSESPGDSDGAYEDVDCSKFDASQNFYLPVRRFLDVIKEETSDISDGEKPRENSFVMTNDNTVVITEDWMADGIDTSWRDGKSLEDMSDIQVVSDSPSDSDLVIHEVDKNEIKPPVKGCFIKKPPLGKPKPCPSAQVVKSVITSYYNHKPLSEPQNITQVQVSPSKIEGPTVAEEVELVYIDSSDSEAISVQNALSNEDSNTSSIEILDVTEFGSFESRKIFEDEVKISSEEIHQISPSKNENIKPKIDDKKPEVPETCVKDILEISESITKLSDDESYIQNQSSIKRRVPLKKNDGKMHVKSDMTNNFEVNEADLKLNTIQNEKNAFSSDSSSSSNLTAKYLQRQIPSLKKLSSEVILGTPQGKTLLKEMGLEAEAWDSCSDYLNETSEYSNASRLSFISSDCDSTNQIRHLKAGTFSPDEFERPSSSGASSIVYITSPDALNEPWIGLPIPDDPRYLVCFSPSQLRSSPCPIDSQKASELFSLHKKFIERRGYHEIETISLEPNLDMYEENYENRDDKTSEILNEAANLLALQEYHKNRQNKMKKEISTSDISFEKSETVDPLINEKRDTVSEPGGNNKTRPSFKSEHKGEVGSSRLLDLIQSEEAKSSTSPERGSPVEKEATSQCTLGGDDDASPTVASDNRVTGDSGEPPSPLLRKYRISKRRDIAVLRPRSLPPAGEELRQSMYEEYMGKVAERMERKQMKVLLVSEPSTADAVPATGRQLEAEFMDKVKMRMEKLGLTENDTEELSRGMTSSEPLPRHLQEFVDILNEEGSGVWSPAQTPEAERKKFNFGGDNKTEDGGEEEKGVGGENKKRGSEGGGGEEEAEKKEDGPVVWTPKSAGPSPTLDRKKYRPVHFESPSPVRKHPTLTKDKEPELPSELPVRIVSSNSENSSLSGQHKLPSAQNPTITLLQKAREGQIPKGAQYLESQQEVHTTSTVAQNQVLYTVKKEYESGDPEDKKKIVELSPRKFQGIGPTTKEGTPIALRSEVTEDNQQRWYKRMYDSLHKSEHDRLDGRWSGYLSEPDRLGYDSEPSVGSNYATLDRRRVKSRETTTESSKYAPAVRHAVNVYKNQPGRIEDYQPGHSSISEREKQQWWDEVLDIFEGERRSENKSDVFGGSLPRIGSGYDSDSSLIYKRRQGPDMSLAEQKTAYKVIQKGGEIPLHGLRKPPPNKPKEPQARQRDYTPSYYSSPDSGREYVESEVNIHYKTPVRTETKEYIEEGELARRQAEAMRRIYQQQRRAKYLAELNDMHARRHTDYFTPSQKSPIPLNRYDDFPLEPAPPRPRDRTPEPKLVARALYNFIGQSSRELSFRRGDIIFVRRQIDKNWYEGEHNAMIGLFPINYVEIIPYDGIRTLPKKSTEGQARAKFNFQAQTHLELSLVKGELVLLTRRVDENWFEGRIGNKKGIFPVSYVQVLVEPGEVTYGGGKPVVAPASHSVMLNGAKDLGSQMQPPRPPAIGSPGIMKESSQLSQLLHIDTRSDPIPYRALYNYKPQNDDELELREGDIVYVMEKCDDGWYVGSLHRNGQFGTFPGNYVQRIS